MPSGYPPKNIPSSSPACLFFSVSTGPLSVRIGPGARVAPPEAPETRPPRTSDFGGSTSPAWPSKGELVPSPGRLQTNSKLGWNIIGTPANKCHICFAGYSGKSKGDSKQAGKKSKRGNKFWGSKYQGSENGQFRQNGEDCLRSGVPHNLFSVGMKCRPSTKKGIGFSKKIPTKKTRISGVGGRSYFREKGFRGLSRGFERKTNMPQLLVRTVPQTFTWLWLKKAVITIFGAPCKQRPAPAVCPSG